MLSRAAKRSGLCDEKGHPRPLSPEGPACISLLQAICFGFAIVLSVVFVVHNLWHSAPAVVVLLTSPGSFWVSLPSGLPVPPRPYHYTEFMAWLKSTDFSHATPALKWQPEPAEFDIDAAAHGKFQPWLKGKFADSAISVAKGINKYSFMDHIMLTGNLDVIGAPGTHLYILRRLLEAAQGSPRPTFVDAGCGPGYLLMAWALAAGEGSRAVGIDVDEAVVASAQRHLTNIDEAFDKDAVGLPKDAKMDAFVGDALDPDVRELGLKLGTVDAINVGLAVNFDSAMEDLSPLVKLLRTGGLIAVPVCSPAEEQPSSIPKGKCAGLFKVFRKSEDGSLQRAPFDPDIPTRFVVALKPGQTTADAQLPMAAASLESSSGSNRLRGKG